jgi:hypothetical protein
MEINMKNYWFFTFFILLFSCASIKTAENNRNEIIYGEVPYSLREYDGIVHKFLRENYLGKRFIYVEETVDLDMINIENIYALADISFSCLNNYLGHDYNYGYSDKKFIFVFENIQTNNVIKIESDYNSSGTIYDSFFRQSSSIPNEEKVKILFSPSVYIPEQRSHMSLGQVLLPINSYTIFLETGIFYPGFYLLEGYDENINQWVEKNKRINDERRALLAYGGTNYIEFTYREAFGNTDKYYSLPKGTILYIGDRSIDKIYGGSKDNIFIFEWEIIGYSREPHTIIQFIVEDNLGLIKFNESYYIPNANGLDQEINIYHVNGPVIIKRIGTMNITLSNGRIVPRPQFELLQFLDYDPRSPNYNK